MKGKVDIVVPVYNEPENFQSFYNALKEQSTSQWRIFAVYDFEEDTTLSTIKQLSGLDPRVRAVRNPTRGVLSAIKTGMRNAECEAVLVAMADDPREIVGKFDEMVEHFYSEGATIVVASRYMKGGAHIGGPIIKGFLSRSAGISLRYLIGLPTHDATYATRLYRKSFLERTPIESEGGFELSLELTLKAFFDEEKIVEIPVIWHERSVGESQFQFRKWLTSYLRWYFWGLSRAYIPFISKKSRKVLST